MKKKLILVLFLILSIMSKLSSQEQINAQGKINNLFAQKKEPIQNDISPGKNTAKPESNSKTSEDIKELPLSDNEINQLKEEIIPDVELNFNNASLQNIVDQISQVFNITFIPDDVVKTPGTTTKPLSDSKISFKTNVPFSRKKAWNFFTMFLELAGWSLVPTSDPQVYRITTIKNANKLPLPTYINTSLDILPESDQRIRYVCFLENSSPEQMSNILKNLTSANAQLDTMNLLHAIIITDAAYNIISLLKIIKELDKTSENQILSVINLKEAETTEVSALIKSLQNKDENASAPWMPKKESSLYYFSKDVTLIPSPRTNSLILVGPSEGVRRIEQFVLSHIDIELKQMYRPIHIYDLNYAPAKQIAEILNNVVQFGKKNSGGNKEGPSASESGAVVGGLKYFGDIFIQPEEQGNRLLIRSNQEDWIHLSKIIDQLDKRQLQVAIEVMIIELDLDRTRQLGVQWQTKNPAKIEGQMTGFFGSNAQVATITDTPAKYSNTLLGNLIGLAKTATTGTTLFTLGKESVYAILGVLSTDTQSRLLANPFIVATNKYQSTVAISETRRAQTQIVGTSQAGISTFDAKLQVSITPQINEFGLINLDINVIIEDFLEATSGTDASNANKTKRQVQTNANVADKEVLALGGLVKRKKVITKSKIPILGDIPLIGNIFKNEKYSMENSQLVIFMSPTIIKPTDESSNLYTRNKSKFMTMVSRGIADKYEKDDKDPIYRWFFKDADYEMADDIEKFVSKGALKEKEKNKAPNIISQSVNQEEGSE
jgi:general secretion pathway protein D